MSEMEDKLFWEIQEQLHPLQGELEDYLSGVDCAICGNKPKDGRHVGYFVHTLPGEKNKGIEVRSPICPICYEELRTGWVLCGIGKVGQYAYDKEYATPEHPAWEAD